MAVGAGNTVYFRAPFINYNVPIPFVDRNNLEQGNAEVRNALDRSPALYTKNIEFIKSIAAAALAALVAFITMPVWLTGMLFGSAFLGVGVFVALPFMGLSLWQLSERVVYAFQEQLPGLLGTIAANLTVSPERATAAPPEPRFTTTRHGDFGAESSYGGAAASGSFLRAAASFGGSSSSSGGPWSSSHPHE